MHLLQHSGLLQYEALLILNPCGLLHKLQKVNLRMETLSSLSRATQPCGAALEGSTQAGLWCTSDNPQPFCVSLHASGLFLTASQREGNAG